MAVETRLYLVIASDGAERLVEAASSAQALRHVSSTSFIVRPAKSVEVLRFMQSGGEPEVARGTVEAPVEDPDVPLDAPEE